MRITKNRKLVLDILNNVKDPISVFQIQERLKKRGEKMHLSTIYRAISWLVDNNKIEEVLEGTSGEKLYQGNQKGHKHYITCTKCFKMEKLEICPLDHIEEEIKSKTNFEVTSHKLVFEGICQDCK